jgi:RNA polymerase I-specific transcription initiation factor RRN3
VDRSIQIDVRCISSTSIQLTHSAFGDQVEIQVELEELDEVEDAQDGGDVFELDPFDVVIGQEMGESDSDSDDDDDSDNLSDLSSDAGDADDTEQTPDVPADARHIHDMVAKLDAILKLIFDYFNSFHAATTPIALAHLPSPTLSPRSESPSSITELSDLPRPSSPVSIERGKAVRRSQFHTLLSIFDRTIIRTFKSRYTQFLVFWYSSLDPEFSDLFQGFLVSKALLEQDQPAVTRAAAASYIASFVSRAQFVDREGARRVAGVLCTFLRNHLDVFDTVLQSGTTMPSMAHHSIFYAVSQAIFLIFCFRWRDLEEELEDADELLGGSAGTKWMSELSVVQRVVTSPLNPLKVTGCSFTSSTTG